VQPRKTKQEPNLTEAAEKTGLLIRGLQSRLLESAPEPADTSANLEKQLEEYFACWPGEESRINSPLNRIRSKVIDGVVERILRAWQQDGKTHPFENEVIERLIDGVLDMLAANGNGPGRPAQNFSSSPKSTTTQLSA
jgi:hypothetical protein